MNSLIDRLRAQAYRLIEDRGLMLTGGIITRSSEDLDRLEAILDEAADELERVRAPDAVA